MEYFLLLTGWMKF